MSAGALTRAFILAAAGCAAPHAGSGVVSGSETIAGRALAGGRLVLLTREPALIVVDLEARTLGRIPIKRGRDDRALWGLGESEGVLYSIAGFTDLVRIDTDGGIRPSARFERAMGNLLDVAGGMVGQIAVDAPGTALAWTIDPSARLSALASPGRAALGLSRAEEGVLHLLSCSVPPRVVCWLPGSNELLAFDGGRMSVAARLEGIDRITPERLLESPALRAIQDALATDRASFIVLHRSRDEADRSVLAEFGSRGQHLRQLDSEPLRLLLGLREGVLLAVAKTGRLVEVPL